MHTVCRFEKRISLSKTHWRNQLQALEHSSLEPTFSSQVDFLKLLHILDTDFLYTAWMYKNNYMKHHYSYKCFSRILEA